MDTQAQSMDFIGAITKEVQKNFQLPDDLINQKVEAILEKRKPRTIIFKRKDVPDVKMEFVHVTFEKLLKLLTCRVPVLIVGPAGSGKTKACEDAAKALGLDFSAISVGPQSTQSHIMGYMDATGKYVATEFRKRFEEGGIFLMDEFDAGSAQVLTCLNSALSGSFCAFPDRMVMKHKDFLCVATGNTYGNGANRVYVGRNQLDGATLDRFVILEWNYDETMERNLANNDLWVERVFAVRKKCEEMGIRAVISPRASIYGSTLLAGGLSQKDVEKMTIFKGMSKEDCERVK